MKKIVIQSSKLLQIYFCVKLECTDSINTFFDKYYPLYQCLIDLHLSHIIIHWFEGFLYKAHSVKDKLYGLFRHTKRGKQRIVSQDQKYFLSFFNPHNCVNQCDVNIDCRGRLSLACNQKKKYFMPITTTHAFNMLFRLKSKEQKKDIRPYAFNGSDKIVVETIFKTTPNQSISYTSTKLKRYFLDNVN